MSEAPKSTILDEIAESKGIDTSAVDQGYKKPKIEQLPQKIAVAGIVLGIYAAIMIGLLTTSNLIFLIALIAYFFVCAPLTKLLKRIFKIKSKSDIK